MLKGTGDAGLSLEFFQVEGLVTGFVPGQRFGVMLHNFILFML